MGKKKEQNIEELEVGIGEASSMGDERGQNQSQPQILRKRGRPRKIVEKKEQLAATEESLEKAIEKNKSREELEGREFAQIDSSACTTWAIKEDGISTHEGEPSRSRKARRKGKPRKSS